MKVYKHLRVSEDTHKIIKSIAALEDKNIDKMILELVSIYKRSRNGITDTRKYR